MKNSFEVKLIPVIELIPSSYSKNEYKSPDKSILESLNDWEVYNQSCYKDFGLKNLKAVDI